MNKRWKRVVASTLVLSMALAGGAATASADSDGQHRGPGMSGKGLAKGHDKDKGKAKGHVKYKLDLDHLKLEFQDVYMDWARQHIASLVAKGVFEGYTDGTFKPNKPVTRLEAIVTAVRLMDLRDEAESEEKRSAALHFKDANKIGDWARGYVAVALENDLFFETEDKLQPEKPADRLWVTTLLVKALDLEDEARAKMTAKLDFKDAAAIPAGSVGYVAVAVEKGIVKGYANNTFRPNSPVTRAEIAAFLDRAGDLMPEYRQGGILKSAVKDNRLTLTNGTEYEVDDDAYVFYNEKRIALEELKAGDRVSFITYNDVIIFIKLIEKAENADDGAVETFRGTLSSGVVSDKLRLYVNGKLETVTIHKDTVIYRGGVKAAASALKVGDTVQVRVKDGAAERIDVETPIEEKDHVYGSIAKVNEDGRKLAILSGKAGGTYEVEDDAQIFRKDKIADLDDLRAGDLVLAILDDDDDIVYIQVVVPNDADAVVSHSGIVSAKVDDGLLSVYAGGELKQFRISDDAVIFRNGVRVNASELKQGDQVTFHAAKNAVKFLVVTERAEEGRYVSGTITAISDDGDEIELRVNGISRDFEIDDDALIFRGETKADVDDLRVGDEVFVRVKDGELTYIQVTKPIELVTFTVEGKLEALVLNGSGKLDTITIRHTVSGNTQSSIYRAADSVKITGDASGLVIGADIRLKGRLGVVTEIEIL
jgi:hypothetical protein